MLKVGIIIILSGLIITSKSGVIIHDGPAAPPKTTYVSSSISNGNDYPPNLLLLNNNNNNNNNNENTRNEDDNNNNKESSKNKIKINEDELKLKLSSMIDNDNDDDDLKLKNKDYKNNFISYILSYNDKKEEYNDDINNGNNEKIKRKYALYIESDEYINLLNSKMDIPVYEHTMYSDWSMEEKKSLLMDENEVETRRRLALQSCYSFAGWGSSKPTTFVSFQNHSQPIKDQLNCGSCPIFASIAQYELNYYIYKGVKQSQSEQYLLDCVGDSIANCYGGYHSNVNKWLGTYGSCPSSCYYNYDGKDTWSCYSCLCNKTPLSNTACITPSSTGYLATSVEYWNTIANTAQYVGLSYVQKISNNFYYLSSSNPYLYECDINNILGSRAMSVYGEYYGNWLLIKNSYGVNWGNQGWFWLNINARTSCMSNSDFSFNYW